MKSALIATTEDIRSFEVRKHPMEQEVFVNNSSYYGQQGYVVDMALWHSYENEQRTSKRMVCIRFNGKGCIWFDQSDPQISIVA